MCEAAAAAEEAGHRGMSSQHHSGSGLAAVREKARAVLDALRTLAKLALRTSAAMQAATASLQTASHVSPAQVLLPSFNPNGQYLVPHVLHSPFWIVRLACSHVQCAALTMNNSNDNASSS